MIDPKLNELPVEGANRRSASASTVEEEDLERRRRSQAGLSINDTIAGQANMSVGGRGVVTSGTETGAGAGAGTTMSTPVPSGQSPAPTIVSGARGSGTTELGTTYVQSEAATLPSTGLADAGEPTEDQIAARAYTCWYERGCPTGSPEVDWHRAVEEIRRERQAKTHARAASV
ncbi:MAG: DUF2934 domain-containing protein [Acidobacteriaceae bacterium]|nr:DUF2934 domain-containing protein [Acidobacteriaceae bacterium]